MNRRPPKRGEWTPSLLTPIEALPEDRRGLARMAKKTAVTGRNGFPEGGGYCYRPGEARREAQLEALVAEARERAVALKAMESLA